MANVSVYNMKGKEVGKMDLNDAVFGVKINEHLVHMEHRRQRHVPKFPAAAESLGDRRKRVMRDRAPQERPSGRAAALCSHPSRGSILSS